MYELQYMKSAEKYFKKIREKGLKDAFRTALQTIAKNPYSGKSKTGDLQVIYREFMFMTFIIIKQTMRLLTIFTKITEKP